VPDYEATLWLSISARPACGGHRAAALHRIAKALQDPELQNSFRTGGVEAMAMPPGELNAYMRTEYEKWGRVVRETGATVN